MRLLYPPGLAPGQPTGNACLLAQVIFAGWSVLAPSTLAAAVDAATGRPKPLSPLYFTFARLLLGGAFLVGVACARGWRLVPRAADAPRVAVMAICGGVLMHVTDRSKALSSFSVSPLPN